MFQHPRQDLEAQKTPASSRDGGGLLRDRVPRYQKDLRALERKNHIELTEGLFWYQDFGSPNSTTRFGFENCVTFGDSLAKLGRALVDGRKASLPSLQLCILNTSPVSTDIYSWGRRLLATNLGRLKGMASLPRYAVAMEVEEGWGALSECSYRSVERPEQLCGVEHLSLPEFRKQWFCHTEADCKCKRFKVAQINNHYDKRPIPRSDVKYGRKMPKEVDTLGVSTFSVELPSKATSEHRTLADEALTSQCLRVFERKTASFTFTWQRAASVYHGGFDTFLWERYSIPPQSDYAEVFYQDDFGLAQPRRALMTVSKTPAWMCAVSLLASMRTLIDGSEDLSEFMRKLSSGQDNISYSLLPLLLVFEQAIADTAVFLQQASDEVMKMSFAGRSDPSVEKIQYLCHLNDCQRSALIGTEHMHSVMKELLNIVPTLTNDVSSAEISFLEEKEKDMAHLIKCLGDLRNKVDDQCRLIKDHRELDQTRQMSLLTKIATIYVPLSFVTGLLGMQVTNPSLIFHHGHRKATSTNTQSILPKSTGVTARGIASASSSVHPSPTTAIVQLLASQLSEQSAIASNTNNNNPYVWSFGFFLGLAGVFFVLGLLLPLVGPNLLRILVQRSYNFRNYTVFWPIVFALYYISVYWMVPEIMQAALACYGGEDGGCNNENNDYFYIYDFKTSGNDAIDTVTYVLSAVVMGSIGLTQLALAVMYRKGAFVTFTWIGFAVVVIAVYNIDYYLSWEQNFVYPISTGLSIYAIIPLVYLLVVWSIPYAWDLWKRRSFPKGKERTD